jgi:hypothetical protein
LDICLLLKINSIVRKIIDGDAAKLVPRILADLCVQIGVRCFVSGSCNASVVKSKQLSLTIRRNLNQLHETARFSSSIAASKLDAAWFQFHRPTRNVPATPRQNTHPRQHVFIFALQTAMGDLPLAHVGWKILGDSLADRLAKNVQAVVEMQIHAELRSFRKKG